jgi:two-component system, sensor histidine kinase and response regulator
MIRRIATLVIRSHEQFDSDRSYVVATAIVGRHQRRSFEGRNGDHAKGYTAMSAPEPSHARVLIVDDPSQQRERVWDGLEQAGYRVSFSDGENALRSFSRSPADLVLLSAALPGSDSFNTCQRLRELPGGDQAAIVLVGAADDPATAQRALDCGADDLLLPSSEPSVLLLRVRSLLRLKQRDEQRGRAAELLRAQHEQSLLLARQREENIALLVHDMKNPLAGVLSNAEFLATSTGLDDDQLSCTQDILNASRRLHRMVMSMLDVSQSEHGVLRPSAAQLDLTELVTAVRLQCAPRLREKSLTLTVVLPPEPVELEVDRDMLTRLLANLLDNAARHAPSGSSISLEVQTEGSAVELRVSDAGPSIPQAERSKLFESYLQGSDNAPRVRARRGLGLSSSRAVAEAHGGRIWVEDNPAEGATFCVRLPRLV